MSRRIGLAPLITGIGAFIACVGDDPAASGGPDAPDANAPDSVATGGDASNTTDGSGIDASTSVDAADAADAGPEPPTAVAPGLTDPVSLAITKQVAIILTKAKVLRCAQKTCLAPAVIGDSLDADLTPTTPRPYLIDADENAIHWISRSVLTGDAKFRYYRCDITEGCPGLVPQVHPSMAEVLAPVGIALGSDGFARIGMKGMILSCDATACPAISGVDVDATRAFAISGTTIFYTDQTDPGGTKKATAGVVGSAKLLHSTVGFALAVQGDNVYTLTSTKIVSCKIGGCTGTPTPFVENEVDLTSMVVGPSGVYWTSNGASADSGTVKMCPLTGCVGSPRVIASGQGKPTSVRLRDGIVYWLNRGTGGATGSLMRAGQ